MLVRDDGTLGRGCLEADVIQAALTVMKEGTCQTISFESKKNQAVLSAVVGSWCTLSLLSLYRIWLF
jgi:xanthine/CO dehydrogenase XdhC/CoxF family maturation factor